MDHTPKHYNRKKRNKGFNKIFQWGIVIAPFFLLLLPVDHFDTGESICVSKFLAGIECYACGLTRGVMHFIHLDFAGAWEFNKLTFIVVPLLSLYWLKALLTVLKLKIPRFLDRIM